MWIRLFITYNLLIGLSYADKPIEKWLPEESPRGTKVANLREELNVSLRQFPTVKFKILEQSLDFGRTSSRPSVTSTSTSWMKVDARTGLMTVQGRIDREKLCGDQSSCAIVVKVVMLPRPNFRFMTVRVNIDDVNDNRPKFAQPVINLNVSESTAPGHQLNLDRFQATDADLGNNSKIRYSLSQTETFFRINYYQVDGVSHLRLVLTNPLDYETTRVHRMVLGAHDLGLHSLSSDVEVKIHVMDENDNFPIFEKEIYEANLRENDPAGHVIDQIQATDMDSGRRGIVRYMIGGDSTDADDPKTSVKWPVSINADSGFVTLREKLDHQRHDGMKILIEAIDGDPVRPKKSKVILRLHVKDVNDNAPVITINYILYSVGDTAYVLESAPIGTFVGHVSATDADEGRNGDVTLKAETIIPGTADIGNLTEPGNFEITEDNLLATGVLLNREARNSYDVIITACDDGSPAQCSHRNIHVVILDVNEFTPTFQHPDIDIMLREDTAIGSVIAQASAVDRDSESTPAWRLNAENEIEPSTNGKVTYGVTLAEIGSYSGDKIPVRINHDNGKIILVRPLDFETRQNWKFVISARDGGRVRLQSTRLLNITVTDVNDNRPIFTFPETSNTTLFASVTSRSQIFAEIKAVDFDTGVSTNIRYSYRITHKNGKKVRHKQYSPLFHLNSDTGQFTSRFRHSDTQAVLGLYKATITARDDGNPPMTSSLILYIDVITGDPPPGYRHLSNSHGLESDDLILANTPFLLAAILGGVFVLLVLILVVFCIVRKKGRKRKKRRKEKEASSPSLQTTATPNDEETESLTPPGGVGPIKFNSPTESRREIESNNHWSQHTVSTRLTSVSSTPDQCRLCDAPTTPGSMQRYIGSQRPRYPSLPRRFGEHPFYTDMRDISSVPPDNYVLPEIPMDVMTMSDKCTELCKTYGHCDTCWMPSAGEPTDQMNHLPSDHAPPWQPKYSSRKDSGCSVDTTSSALSYYKMTRAEQRRRNDLLLPDVVAKSRGAVGSDANSLMSSTNSSGASSTRTNDFRNTSCNQKSQNHRVLKKSNSDTGYDTKSGPRKAIIPNSLSTQC